MYGMRGHVVVCIVVYVERVGSSMYVLICIERVGYVLRGWVMY